MGFVTKVVNSTDADLREYFSKQGLACPLTKRGHFTIPGLAMHTKNAGKNGALEGDKLLNAKSNTDHVGPEEVRRPLDLKGLGRVLASEESATFRQRSVTFLG